MVHAAHPSTSASSTTRSCNSCSTRGAAATTDAQRKPIYEAINRRFASQVYNLWGYYIRWVIAAKPNVNGVLGPPLPDNGGQPQYLYGRLPVLGLWIKS